MTPQLTRGPLPCLLPSFKEDVVSSPFGSEDVAPNYVGFCALAALLWTAQPAKADGPSWNAYAGLTVPAAWIIPPQATTLPPASSVPATPAFGWDGLYVGGHVGYSRGSGQSTCSSQGRRRPALASAASSAACRLVTISIAVSIPLGFEADVSFPNFLDDGIVALRPTSTTLTTEQLDFVSTLRGRVGYAFNPWLFYVTAASHGLEPGSSKVLVLLTMRTKRSEYVRVALGAGVEVPIAAAWTGRLEYIYDHLGSVHATFPSGSDTSPVLSLGTVRLGLNRQLSTSDNGTLHSSDQWPLDPNNWNVHGQFTYIDQGYPPLDRLIRDK